MHHCVSPPNPPSYMALAEYPGIQLDVAVHGLDEATRGEEVLWVGRHGKAGKGMTDRLAYPVSALQLHQLLTAYGSRLPE